MEIFYVVVFGVLAVCAAVLETTKKTSNVDNSSKEFSRFKNNYVLVYALMMGAIRLIVLLSRRPSVK